MPGLIAFRRRWSTGSDDLVVPGFMLFGVHVILFFIIGIAITTSDLDDYASISINDLEASQPRNDTLISQVKCAQDIRNYSIGYLVLLAVAAIIEAVLSCFSMRGTILDPKPREAVEYLIYIRIMFGIIEMIFSVISAIRIAADWSLCGVVPQLQNMHIGIVVINFIVLVIVLLVGYCVFDPAGGKYYDVQRACERESISQSRMENMRNELDVQVRQTWLSKLSNCFCCVSNNSANIKQVALDEVSTLLHNFFRDYDFVLSDIISGLTLLRHKQKCIENDRTISECWCHEQAITNGENDIQEFMCGRPIYPDTSFVDLGNKTTKKECEDIAYYCAYSLAAYGPLFYCIENSGSGICGVLKECLCGDDPTFESSCCTTRRGTRRRKTLIHGDDSCGWAHAGIRKSLKEHEVDCEIVYVSFENEIYHQPFYLCVDHIKKAIVVTVRGTLADEDALTDFVASAEIIDTIENDGTWKAHKGMLRGAEFIKNKLLEDEKVLSMGFGHSLAKGTRDYDLVLVGHSLGAGVASILAILLHPLYPNIKCYAYSPPGGLLSHSAMLASRDYVRTLIFGKDIIARAGVAQLESLRNEVIHLLRHTEIPKYKIILGNLCGPLEHRHRLLRSERLSSRMLRTAARRLDTTATEIVSCVTEELYPPGKIFHLLYSSEEVPRCGGCKKKIKKYYLAYADNVSDFSEIIVSHQMISHHLPQEVLRCVKKALSNYPNDRNNTSYEQAATLPFVENPQTSMQSRPTEDTRANNNKDVPITEQPQLMAESPDHSSMTDSVKYEDDSPTEPFLNTNQNNSAGIVEEIRAITATSSSDSSSSSTLSIPDKVTKAPLARPESFTLSIHAQSPPGTLLPIPKERKRKFDVIADESADSSAIEPLLSSTSLPQASSTPHQESKTSTMESKSVSFSDRNSYKEDQYDSNISCDDLNIDIHGRNAIS